ncbi:MAG: hypothetical protein MSC31_16455 [Solirubrobacteraceae bacterium MAG38_C4-C5]|nr:hypothetical protein [Candidatus Siliceabacter maunaloa]
MQRHPTTQSPCGEGQAGQRLDRDEVRGQRGHVEDDDLDVAAFDEEAQALAQRGHIGARERADGKDDGGRLC